MDLVKGIIYILVYVGMLLTALFFEELGMISVVLAYTFGVGVGFVVWKKDNAT